jgi:hypothetical protein
MNDIKLNYIMNDIKLNYIDDWKNESKINFIKDLITSGSIDRKTLLNIIGNQSKKTYRNGEIIDDKSFALQKFFDTIYRDKSSIFYTKLDEFILKIVNNELFEKSIYDIIKLIRANTICIKYNETQFLEYKMKITDILETRNKEEQLFDLFNRNIFKNLVIEPNHEALKYLLDNGWKETKEKYEWLTALITFINNGSISCKEYLISLFNFKPIKDSDIKAKKLLIKLVAQRKNLNKNRINEIIDFIFSIGNYYKHGTYYKWYYKELEYIQLFEKYKGQTIQSLIEQLNLDSEYCFELTNLLNQYQILINEHFT